MTKQPKQDFEKSDHPILTDTDDEEYFKVIQEQNPVDGLR